MQTANFNQITTWLQENKKFIDEVKITSYTSKFLNTWNGTEFWINLKIITTDEYKNKLICLETNYSYLEDFVDENSKYDWEYLTEYLNEQLVEY